MKKNDKSEKTDLQSSVLEKIRGPEPPMAEPLQLDGQQKALYDALSNKNSLLSDMYLGALKVFKDETNPDRFSLSAHNMRELMDKAPPYMDVGLKDPYSSEKMSNKVDNLEKEWNRLIKGVKKIDDCNKLDKVRLEKFLKACGKFFNWFKESRPKLKKKIAKLIRTLDPTGLPLPSPIEELRVNEWGLIRDYFLHVCHHDKPTNIVEFESWLHAMERFFLDRLQPQTYADLNLIKSIIRAGEGDANP